MEEKHVSHMGSKTMAGTQHDSHMGSQSMEKQPTGSKHSCCKASSTATGLWQDILDFFLLAQEDFCLVWPLWSHHFLAWLQPWPWPSGAGSGASPHGAWSHPGAGNPSTQLASGTLGNLAHEHPAGAWALLALALVWREWLEGGNACEPHGLTVAMWLHEPWKETT